MINIDSKVFLAGHNGMLGSSIFRILKKKGYKKIITIDNCKSKVNNIFNYLILRFNKSLIVTSCLVQSLI